MKKENMKIALSLLEQTTVYGPPPENVYRDRNETNTEQEETHGQSQENNGYNSIKENFIMTQNVYGPPPVNSNTNTNKVLDATNIGIWIVLFIFGIIAILNKKLSKTAKAVIAVSIVAVGVVLTLAITILKAK